MARVVTLLIIILTSLALVSAHLSGGKHISIDDYFIELGHKPDRITQGDTTTFLITAAHKNGTQVPVDKTHVTIRHDTTYLAATMQANQAGSTSFNYAFPKPGSYNVTLSFQANQETLIQHTTQLAVVQPDTDPWYASLWPFST